MYPNLATLILFCIAAGFTPGPNNILGSYQGFNFGIKKSLPLIIGVTFGYTFLLIVLAAGLIAIFKTYPLLQIILKICGSAFLIYLAYKIAFQNKIEQRNVANPVNFFDGKEFDRNPGGKKLPDYFDEWETFLTEMINKNKNISFYILGLGNEQPKWNYEYYKELAKCKMAL